MIRQNFADLHIWNNREPHAGCSKRPDFSAAKPWRAETRLVPSKAAAEEQAAGVPSGVR